MRDRQFLESVQPCLRHWLLSRVDNTRKQEENKKKSAYVVEQRKPSGKLKNAGEKGGLGAISLAHFLDPEPELPRDIEHKGLNSNSDIKSQ